MFFNKKLCYGSLWVGLFNLVSPLVFAASCSAPIACTVEALNAAIIAANTTPSTGESVLILPANCTYLIDNPVSPTTGLPLITGNITIVGGTGTVIARNPSASNFRIFRVLSGATLKLQNLEIQNGNAIAGGGILDEGTLVLEKVTLSHNNADEEGGGLAVALNAQATVIGSAFLFNTTDPGASAGGGGISTRGTLLVKNTNFFNNSGPTAGALVVAQFSTTTIQNSEFANNTADLFFGGAIGNSGMLSIDNSIIHFNTAATVGGGIVVALGTVVLNNTTIVDNNPDNCFPLNSISGCLN